MDPDRIVVAMSGGVDSSVAAALLVREGLDVIGCRFRFAADSEAASRDDADASAVADRLGFELRVVDRAEAFDRVVVKRFVDEYASGRTPSPCVWCNRHMKFRALRDLADEVGAALVATGHYARTQVDPSTGRVRLLRGRDPSRDQSYYLSLLSQDDLARVRFPMGGLDKNETRRIAAELDLPVAAKADSQELCFVPDDRYAEFVRARISDARPGEIVDAGGAVLGRHTGIVDYTVGQRRGLGVAAGKRLYVTRIDAGSGRVVVGDDADLAAGGLVMSGVNWIGDPTEAAGARLSCKIRYRHPGADCELDAAGGGRWRVRFASTQRAVTPGQAAVVYDGERVLCAGWIERALAPGEAG